MFWRILQTERKKIHWILVAIILFVGPILSVINQRKFIQTTPELGNWLAAFPMSTISYASLFLPISVGILAALICRSEHIGGGWKQLLALPITRLQLFFAKYLIVIGLIAIMQLIFFLCFLGMGLSIDLHGDIPWGVLGEHLFFGWLATLPLAALQLWVSTLWSNFAAPLALNIALTIPAMLAANSELIGPLYPWSQPILMMAGEGLGQQMDSLIFVVGGMLCLFLILGSWSFYRRDFQ